jgi:hypothetical protein
MLLSFGYWATIVGKGKCYVDSIHKMALPFLRSQAQNSWGGQRHYGFHRRYGPPCPSLGKPRTAGFGQKTCGAATLASVPINKSGR